MVDVVNERVERAHALLQAALEPDPLFERQHAGHDVEGDQALGAFVLAVDGERDADAVEQGIGLGALLRQALRGLVVEPLGIASVVRSGATLRPGTFRYTVWPKTPLVKEPERISCHRGARAHNHVLSAGAPQCMHQDKASMLRPPARLWCVTSSSCAPAQRRRATQGSPGKSRRKVGEQRLARRAVLPPPAAAIRRAICSVATADLGRNVDRRPADAATTSSASPLRFSVSKRSTYSSVSRVI